MLWAEIVYTHSITHFVRSMFIFFDFSAVRNTVIADVVVGVALLFDIVGVVDAGVRVLVTSALQDSCLISFSNEKRHGCRRQQRLFMLAPG